MGDGEFSGNGSVYWSIDHGDGADLKVKTNDSNRPPKNGTTNVHVKTKANGRDPIDVADVGKRKGHTGKFRVRLRFESNTAAQGAATSVHLASAPELEGVTGGFFAELKPKKSSPRSNDEETATRLWRVSAELVGLDSTI